MNYLTHSHSSHSKSKLLEQVRQVILSDQFNPQTNEPCAMDSKSINTDNKR